MERYGGLAMTYYDLLEEQYMQQVMKFYEGVEFSNVNIEIKEGVVYVSIDGVEVELNMLIV